MKVTQLEVIIHRRERNPDPIGDAIQALPGAGSVQVIAHRDEGISGSGELVQVVLARTRTYAVQS